MYNYFIMSIPLKWQQLKILLAFMFTSALYRIKKG